MGLYEDFQANGPQTAAQKVQSAITTVAPAITTFTNQRDSGVFGSQNISVNKSGGTLPEKLANFVGTVFGQAGDIAGGAIKGLFDTTVEAVEAPFKFGANIGNEINIAVRNQANSKQSDLIESQITQLAADYKAGKITRDQYHQGLTDLNGNLDNLMKATNENQAAANQNAADTLTTGITVAEDVIAIVTAGTSTGITALAVDGSKALGDGTASTMINFFGKKEVSDQLFNSATKVDSIVQKAVDGGNYLSTLNGRFSSATIANITHESIAAGAETLSAKKIATNVAVNLILKKPLVYQTNIDLATDIYKDMQKGDIGGTALLTAITASMALSGGPVGWALETAGKGFGYIRAATFGSGNVAEILKAENAANKASGLAENVTKEIIDRNAKESVSQQSFIDALSTKFGSRSASQLYNELVKRAQTGDINSYKAVKVLEETNMKMAGGNSVNAAEMVAAHYNGLDGGKWLSNASASDIIDDMVNWSTARETVVQDAIKNGMSHAEAARIVVGRANQSDLTMIADFMAEADKSVGIVEKGDQVALQKLHQARLDMFQQVLKRYGRTPAWANSDTFITEINHILTSTDDVNTMTKKIKSIRTGSMLDDKAISQETRDQLSKQGYLAIMPKRTHTPYIQYADTTGGLKSRYAPKNAQEFNNERLGLPGRSSEETATKTSSDATLFEQAVAPVPVLSSVGAFLTKLGLSPEASQEMVQKSFQANFSRNVESALAGTTSDINLNGQAILSKLYDYVKKEINPPKKWSFTAPVVDLRQMSGDEIKAALNISDNEAKRVAGALNSAMLQVPISIRGAGDRLLDLNTNFNKAAAPFARLQGATRFVWNPFFKWQQSYQTEGLAQLEAGGKTAKLAGVDVPFVQLPFLNGVNKILFSKDAKAVDDTITTLEARGIFGAGLSGQAAGGDVSGLIGTRIIKSEKISLAGLVNAQAKKLGMKPDEYIDTNQSAVVDTLRMITTNDHTQNFTDSPLARTINTAFFPFRYNLKVANLMAGYIGKMSAPTQVAMVASLMNASDWLGSDQGIAWQQTHAEAIGLFNWLSPTYPLTYVMKLGQDVAGQSDFSIGDLGLLGGLPFGMISQFLNSAGVIDTSAPYLNPKTGDAYPKYVPQTAKAGVNLAIQDFVGSLFSYPGAIVGLPSKVQAQLAVGTAIAGGRSEFQQEDQSDKLSPRQLHQQAVIKGNTSSSGTTPPAPSTPADNNVTVVSRPGLTAPPRASTSSAGAKKKKKSQYIPVPIDTR